MEVVTNYLVTAWLLQLLSILVLPKQCRLGTSTRYGVTSFDLLKMHSFAFFMLPITLDRWNGSNSFTYFFIFITHPNGKQFQNCRRINCGRSHLKKFNETAFEDEGSRDNICIIDNDITGKILPYIVRFYYFNMYSNCCLIHQLNLHVQPRYVMPFPPILLCGFNGCFSYQFFFV